MNKPQTTPVPYRELTDDELYLLRRYFSGLRRPTFDLYANWEPGLRRMISEAVDALPGSQFEYSRADNLYYVIARHGTVWYAISPSLQQGIPKWMLRSLQRQFVPWDGWRLFKTSAPVDVIILASSIYFLLYGHVHTESYWMEWVLNSSWLPMIFGILAAFGLGTRFYRDNPIRHYREQAELGSRLLAHLLKETPEELEAEYRELMRPFTAREQEIAAQRTDPPNGSPQPA